MTNTDRETIIQNAIWNYKRAQQMGDRQQIAAAVNDMENTFIAVSLWAVKGTEELRQLILSARA